MKTPFKYTHANETVPNTLGDDVALLDHFAGLAMQVALKELNLFNGVSSEDIEIICDTSYTIAKVMLKARKEAQDA